MAKMRVAVIEIRFAGDKIAPVKSAISDAIDDLFENRLSEIGGGLQAESTIRFYIDDGSVYVDDGKVDV